MSSTRVPLLFLLAVPLALAQTGGLTITTPAALPPAIASVPYSQSLAATGGTPPYAWSLLTPGTMPPGLALSLAGAITGTPETTGTFGLTMRVTDSAGASATQTFTMAIITGGALTRFGTLAHIAAGGWWDTTLTLINTTSVPIAITVVFRGDDGTPLNLPLKLTQEGSTQSSTASSLTAALNPNSTVVIGTGVLPNTVVGWADVLGTGPVGGFAILRTSPTNPGDKPSEATVPLQSSFSSSLTLPFDNTAGYIMGVALVNLAVDSANLTATIWDDSGARLGVQQISLPGTGHTSFVLADQFSLTAGKRGIIQFQNASGGVSLLGLRFSPAGPFTDVPLLVQQVQQ